MLYHWTNLEKTFKMSGHKTPFEQVMSRQWQKHVDNHLHFLPYTTHYLLKRGHVKTYFKDIFEIYPMVYHLNQLETCKKIYEL